MEAAGRRLEIESVDEQILALAKEAAIPGRHPLLSKAAERFGHSGGGRRTDKRNHYRNWRGGHGPAKKKKLPNGAPRRRSAPRDPKPSRSRCARKRWPEPFCPTPIPKRLQVRCRVRGRNRTQGDRVSSAVIFSRVGRRPIWKRMKDIEEEEERSAPRRRLSKGIGITVGVVVLAVLVLFGVTRFWAEPKIID